MSKPLGDQIKRVVVLMLENRSFDNMLGALYPQSSTYEGLSGTETNPTKPGGSDFITVFQGSPGLSGLMAMPNPDPGEFFSDMNIQIFGSDVTDGSPSMQGFAWNYSLQHYQYNSGFVSGTTPITYPPIKYSPVARDIMQYYLPSQVPVTTGLASGFAVSDQWFGASPTQTFPNRVFCHCATPSIYKKLLIVDWHGRTNDDQFVSHIDFPLSLYDVYGSVPHEDKYPANSVMWRFDQVYDSDYGPGSGSEPPNANWKIYYHDACLSALLRYVNDRWDPKKRTTPTSANVIHYDDKDYGGDNGGYNTFAQDCAAGTLPRYSFIEPRYFNNYGTYGYPPNNSHPGGSVSELSQDSFDKWKDEPNGPPINVLNGEQLLLDIYKALYSNPTLFNETLLIVIYDEHGGLYDHVKPSVSPYNSATVPWTSTDPTVHGFQFNRFGPRVPAFFINPYIQQSSGTQSAYRPAGANNPPYTPFDHTSVISTLWAQFGLTGTGTGSLPSLTPRDAAAPQLTNLVTLTHPRTDMPDPSTLQSALNAARQANPL